MIVKNKNILNLHLKEVNPLICGKEICESGHSYGPGVREYFILHFVVCGKGKFVTDKGVYNLSAGAIFVIRPYETIYYEADISDPWTYVWVGFDLSEELSEPLFQSDYFYAEELRKSFEECIEKKDIIDGASGYELFLCGQIFKILSDLKEKSTKNYFNYISSAINIMETEFTSNITVDKISDRLHLDRSYFTSAFTKTVKCSPGKYLTNLRMDRAHYLLKEKNYSVTVTARSVGYKDVFTFSRAFKNYYGFSPNEFKNNEKKESDKYKI